ncbi:MAG: DUF418 domain-containing protein [Robiginitomaculum sp.]|nr:DUF418 domain-containing protein [Robiginitomaculum sp.]
MNYATDSAAAGRHIMPDLVRSFAIIGIALVNVALFAYPMQFGFFDGGFQTTADHWAHFTTTSLFAMKSYSLFSFMFGVGFAYQIQSASRSETGFGGRYSRRIIGLLVLGLAHIAFAFQGDILLLYGLIGIVLFMFRDTKVKTLCWVAGVFIVLQILFGLLMAGSIWAGINYAPEEMSKAAEEMTAKALVSREVFGAGSFVDSIYLRLSEYSDAAAIFIYQGLGVFGYFLLGLAAVKSGIISDPNASIWKKFRRFALPIGVLGSAYGAWLMMISDEMLSVPMMAGFAVIGLFAPLSTAGYLGLIAKWASGPVTKFKTFLARGGTATLSAYLMQSVLLSLIFNNYGLGLFGKLGAAYCVAIALAVAVFTLAFMSLWRKKFKLGPVEYIFRGWTYLGKR